MAETGPKTVTVQSRDLTPAFRVLVPVFAGLFAGLGHVPFSLVPLSLFGFALAIWVLLQGRSSKQAALTGWLFGTGHFGITLFWIVEPFQIDAELHGWIAPFALVLLAAGLALFWGLAFWGAAKTGGRDPLKRAIALVASLGLIELSRAYVLTGFPWALPAYVWVETDVRGWASLVGSHGLSVLTLSLCALAALAVSQRSSRSLAGGATLAAGIIFLLAGPRLLPEETDLSDRPIVRLVQPNAPQDQKWDAEKAIGFVRRQILFTAEASDPRPDLIVWPETAIPWLLDRAGPVLEEVSAASGGAPVILGAQRFDGAEYFNALAVIGPSGLPDAIYDKHHLVPFGEYMPFPALFRATGIRGIAERADGAFAAGSGPALLDLGPLGRMLPLICYEVIFPQNLRGTERPDFLVNITNDAWFGQFAGPQQHFAQARMRAVESGLPMARAANTGISAMIDPGGRVLGYLPLGEAGYLDQQLPAPAPATPYSRFGDFPILVLLGVGLAAVWLQRRAIGH